MKMSRGRPIKRGTWPGTPLKRKAAIHGLSDPCSLRMGERECGHERQSHLQPARDCRPHLRR